MPILREILDAATAAADLELMPEEEIKFQQANSEMIIGTNSEGKGLLLLTTARVVFRSSGKSENIQLTLDYPSVVLHAVSRDPKAWKEACTLYTFFLL